MIKWFSISRLKTVSENESPSQFTNDPLAAITGFGSPEGKCQIYAVSRVNPIFEEEKENKTKGPLKNNLDEAVDQLSPRKSISSGYESRFNSSSDSSSCAEYEDKRFQSPVNEGKREKRLIKQTKIDKKKKTDSDKWEAKEKITQDSCSNSVNLKRRQRKLNNGSPVGSSNLSPIPEGKIDCSIPPPIWPRFEENYPEKRFKNIDVQVPGRLHHNKITSPVNYIFKYNENFSNQAREEDQTLWSYINKKSRNSYATAKEDYEQNWAKCRESHFKSSNCCENDEKSFNSESAVEKLFESRKELTREVLDDLAKLIAYAMTKTNSLSLDTILKNLAESVQKSLEILARTENDESLKTLCENLNRNKYLNKLWAAVQCHDENYHIPPSIKVEDSNKNNVSTSHKTHDQRKVIKKSKNLKVKLPSYKVNDLKDDIYSYGSEGKNSSSSSSGCKDLYLSSNSSSVEKDINASNIQFFVEGVKPLVRDKKQTDEQNCKKNEETSENGVINLIHHDRDCSSSSTESAFGYSDTSTPVSDSSFAQGVLNPVFLHENMYSMPKRVQNAIVCDSFDRTIGENHRPVKNCGSSAFDKLISAKRKISRSSNCIEKVGPLPYVEQEKPCQSPLMTSVKMDNTVFKKIEHPYYVAVGRPDFTLDLPQAEKLMKKIASSKRRRCWCKFMTPLLGLVFFLLSVMLVSLVVTKGRRMFGAL